MKSNRSSFCATVTVLMILLGIAPAAHALQFRLLGWSSDDIDLLFGEKKPIELSVSVSGFSPVYEFKGDGPLVLYKEVLNDKGLPVRQTACTVTIPKGMEKGILILVPGDSSRAASRKVVARRHEGPATPDAPLIYDYILLDDSEAARPSGTIEFHNFSSLPIALKVETHQVVLAPKEKAQVPLQPGVKRLAFRAAAQLGGKWKVFLTNPLTTRGPDRMMVVLRDGPPSSQSDATGEPNIRMISLYDWPARPAPSTTQLLSSASR